MRKMFIISAFLFSITAIAENEKKTTTSKIEEVTVFLTNAQIKSTATIAIPEGITDVVIEKLPEKIISSSLQVSGKGNFTIMAVKHTYNFLSPLEKSRVTKILEDSIRLYQFLLDSAKNLKDILGKEEEMIIANQSLRGGQGTLNGEALENFADALEELADFFRLRIMEIRTIKTKNDRYITKIQEKIQRLENQLNYADRNRKVPGSVVIVTVSAKAPVNGVFTLNYVVNEAGWYALYDIRAKDTKSPIQLNYKAKVYQTTGIDWVNVKLKLSTQNPSLSGTKPTLNPMYLNIYSANYSSPKKIKGTYKSTVAMDELAEGYSEMAISNQENNADNVASYTTSMQNTLAAEFDIKPLYTIPSNQEGQMVDLQVSELPASFIYSAVPKLDNDAFLLANITGWESLNLLSGDANIYFEGTFVGTSFIDMITTRDTLSLSLGRDKKVIIERKNVKEFTSKKLIGTNRKEEFAYEISIYNTKKEAIDIIIEDQYPVSQNSAIEVELLQAEGAEKNASFGKLIWKMKVEPAETKKIAFKYSVKYPKDKIITGL